MRPSVQQATPQQVEKTTVHVGITAWSWDALGSVAAVGATTTTVGMTHRGFTTTDSTRQFFQVGFKCHSASGSEPDKGSVNLQLQFRS